MLGGEDACNVPDGGNKDDHVFCDSMQFLVKKFRGIDVLHHMRAEDTVELLVLEGKVIDVFHQHEIRHLSLNYVSVYPAAIGIAAAHVKPPLPAFEIAVFQDFVVHHVRCKHVTENSGCELKKHKMDLKGKCFNYHVCRKAMATRYAEQLVVPEVQHVVPIETIIDNLRKEIDSNCTTLVQRARMIYAATEGTGPFRLRFWEMRINQIRDAERRTYSIQELRHLKRQCHTLSQDMEQFSRGLL